MTALLHVGNVLYLVAYSVRDMLWLRIITVIATLLLLPYYYARGPLYEPIMWCTLFTLVNLVQIALLILEKRPVFLGEEELQLYRTIFFSLKPREFAKLLSLAQWKRAKEGEELLPQCTPVEELLLISTGKAGVEIDGRRVAELRDGQFIGEMGFLADQVSSARVVSEATTHFLAWPAQQLRELLAATPALHVKVQGILGCDVVAKLRQGGLASAHPSGWFAPVRIAEGR